MKTLGLALAALASIAFFAALGQWQLRRAAERDALERQFALATQMPALDVAPLEAADGDLRYRRIELAGHYDPEIQVLLDNMTRAGVAGYEVLTPFQPAGGGRAVVVNRGWVAGAPDRLELPEIAVAADARVLRGRIGTLPVPALRLDAGEPAPEGPVRVLSFPRQGDLEQVFGREVVPYQVLLDAADPDGYLRDAAPSPEAAGRHVAYAVQWFALAAATAVGALTLALRSASRAGPPQ